LIVEEKRVEEEKRAGRLRSGLLPEEIGLKEKIFFTAKPPRAPREDRGAMAVKTRIFPR
jgi:hypothetical protein